MTIEQIYEDIKTIASRLGCPEKDTAYDVGTAPEPPYLIWYIDKAVESFDNVAYVKGAVVTLEYYSNARDYSAEAKIEGWLSEKETSFEVEHERIDEELMDMTRYQYEEILDNEQQD